MLKCRSWRLENWPESVGLSIHADRAPAKNLDQQMYILKGEIVFGKILMAAAKRDIVARYLAAGVLAASTQG